MDETAIARIVKGTYGDTYMASALTAWLVDKIPTWDEADRERQIMLACWDWFSGGTTAEGVAHRIEASLTTDSPRNAD